jgi:hypothetical protein
MNKVVARYADGRIVKGMTADFFPNKDVFHVMTPDGAPIEIWKKELKALFFVKDLEGDPSYNERKEFDGAPIGRAIKVTFTDGEVLVGTTTGYQPGRPGFFLEPADPNSNNERCYIVAAATREVTFI